MRYLYQRIFIDIYNYNNLDIDSSSTRLKLEKNEETLQKLYLKDKINDDITLEYNNYYNFYKDFFVKISDKDYIIKYKKNLLDNYINNIYFVLLMKVHFKLSYEIIKNMNINIIKIVVIYIENLEQCDKEICEDTNIYIKGSIQKMINEYSQENMGKKEDIILEMKMFIEKDIKDIKNMIYTLISIT